MKLPKKSVNDCVCYFYSNNSTIFIALPFLIIVFTFNVFDFTNALF